MEEEKAPDDPIVHALHDRGQTMSVRVVGPPETVTLADPTTHNDPPPPPTGFSDAMTTPPPDFSDPFPPPHTDPYLPHTDPIDEFVACQDDPGFRYDYKGTEQTCQSLWLNRQKFAICRFNHDGGDPIGVRFCPETCGMVDECLEAATRGGGGGGGAWDATLPTEPAMPRTDSIEEFNSKINLWHPCRDDPDFVYDHEGTDHTCRDIGVDRNKHLACRKELDGGVPIGVRHCPETCDMVDECLEEAAALAARGGGGEGEGAGDATPPTEPVMPHTDPIDEFVDPAARHTVAATAARSTTGPETGATATTGDAADPPVAPSTRVATTARSTAGPETGATATTEDAAGPAAPSTNAATTARSTTGPDVSSSAATTTALSNATTTTTRAEHWWPVEPPDDASPTVCVYSSAYPDDYLVDAVRSVVLFRTEDECCAAYGGCQAAITTLPNNLSPVKWYPDLVDGVPACVRDGNYSPEYTLNEAFWSTFLFESQEGCCEAFPRACARMFWYPSDPSTATCVFGEDYPESMVGDYENYLFRTEGECCERWCRGTTTTTTTTTTTSATTTTAGAGITDSSATGTTAATTMSAAAPDIPCASCTWHESIAAFETCTNSLSYPPSWNQQPARAYFFFETAEGCCETRFPGGCTVDDVNAGGGIDGGDGTDGDGPEFAPLGPRTIDDFDGPARGLPFDFGDPRQWTLEAIRSRSGSYSVTNIPSSELGAKADLTLKISVSQPSTVSCMAIVDTSMPYELFYLEIDGQQRNTYHQPEREMGWVQILTGLAPGEHTVVFRVENVDFVNGLGATRIEHFGSGRVWLDDCQVNPL
mmetsp:Transcript_21488/g.45922  ORF Transcript_21488/g.45922 Transcript_21488/m.45922 type:complete len:821 (-) Transcript_21488:312-2774(-)